MISPCPYCRTAPEEYRYVEYIDSEQSENLVQVDEDTVTRDPTYEMTTCVIFEPCGHAFEKDSIKPVLSELREIRELRFELNRTEDSDRVKELKEYEIPAQINAVNNRLNEVERRKDVESENAGRPNEGLFIPMNSGFRTSEKWKFDPSYMRRKR